MTTIIGMSGMMRAISGSAAVWCGAACSVLAQALPPAFPTNQGAVRASVPPPGLMVPSAFLTNPAAIPGVPAAGPKIKFAAPVQDLGKVNAGQVVKHEFIFTNIGTQTLDITDVRPSCGCTTAGTYERKIEPGRSGIIPVQFNSANFSGQVHKSVTVTCNDPVQPTTILQFTASVWKAVDVNPAFAMFSPAVGATNTETKVVKIVNNLDEPLKLGTPVCTNQAFRVQLKTVREGKEFELEIQLATNLGPGTIMAPVTVTTSSSNLPLVSITAYAIIQPAVTVAPAQILLQAGTLPAGYRPSATVRNNSTSLIELSDVSVNAPDVKAQVQTAVTGKLWTVTLSFPTNFHAPSGQRLELTMKTTHPQHPELKVPIIAMGNLPMAPHYAQPTPPMAPPARPPLPAGQPANVTPYPMNPPNPSGIYPNRPNAGIPAGMMPQRILPNTNRAYAPYRPLPPIPQPMPPQPAVQVPAPQPATAQPVQAQPTPPQPAKAD